MVEQFLRLFADQRVADRADFGAQAFGAPAHRLAEQIAQIERADALAGHAGQVKGRQARRAIGDVDLDLAVFHLALPQAVAKAFARRVMRVGADHGGQQAFFRRFFGLRGDFAAARLAQHDDGGFHQIAQDLVDVAADIANFGELGRFDFQERRAGDLGQPPGDLGFADTGRADHQNVFRGDLVADRVRRLLAAPAITQGDRHRAFGLALADNKTIQFRNDLARGQRAHCGVHTNPIDPAQAR